MKYLLLILTFSFTLVAQVPEQSKKSQTNKWIDKIRLIKKVTSDDYKRVMNLAHSIVLELDKPLYTKDEKALLLDEVLVLYSKLVKEDANAYTIEFIYEYYINNMTIVKNAVKKKLNAKDQELFFEHIQTYKRLRSEGNG